MNWENHKAIYAATGVFFVAVAVALLAGCASANNTSRSEIALVPDGYSPVVLEAGQDYAKNITIKTGWRSTAGAEVDRETLAVEVSRTGADTSFSTGLSAEGIRTPDVTVQLAEIVSGVVGALIDAGVLVPGGLTSTTAAIETIGGAYQVYNTAPAPAVTVPAVVLGAIPTRAAEAPSPVATAELAPPALKDGPDMETATAAAALAVAMVDYLIESGVLIPADPAATAAALNAAASAYMVYEAGPVSTANVPDVVLGEIDLGDELIIRAPGERIVIEEN